MPITRKQFEIGVDTKIEEWMKKILAFLAEHKDEAFTHDELRKAILGTSWKISEREAFDEALNKLVELGGAEKRIIRGTDYYSYREQPKEKDKPRIKVW